MTSGNVGKNRTWQTIFYELFESFFQQIVPGSIAVLLYFQPWADSVLGAPNFMSALIFFILAWIVGNVLSVLSWTFPKHLPAGRLACYLFHRKEPKSIEQYLFKFPFAILVKLQHQNADGEITIQRRTHVATTIMFRNLAALSATILMFQCLDAFTLIPIVLSPSLWPEGVYGISASIICFVVCLFSWFFMRRQLTENVFNVVRDYAEQIGIPVRDVRLGPDGKTLVLSTVEEIPPKAKEDLTKFCTDRGLKLEVQAPSPATVNAAQS